MIAASAVILSTRHTSALSFCLGSSFILISAKASFWENTAHSALIGLKVVGLPADCTSIGRFIATHHWDYGIFTWTASSLIVTQSAIGIGRVGLVANVFGPNPVQHLYQDKQVRLEDSLLVGELPGEVPCLTSRPPFTVWTTSFGFRTPKVGVMMSTFSRSRGKMDGTGPWHLCKSLM